MVILNFKLADSATADENISSMSHLTFICHLDKKNKALLMPRKPAPKIDPGIAKFYNVKKEKKAKKAKKHICDIEHYKDIADSYYDY